MTALTTTKTNGTVEATTLATSPLYSNTVIAKVWKTATEHLKIQNPPQDFPETVPQTGDNVGKYQYRDAEFWTCGFFPGNIYCLLERSMKYPQAFLTSGPNFAAREQLRNSLLGVCRAWSEPLHDMAYRTDTHDIGFIIEPALRRDFELTGNMRSYNSILAAAESLASRFSKKTHAIRSWDTFVNNGHNFNDKEKCFLLIIDSMCNLDLLFYVAHHTSNQWLEDVAVTHAHTIRTTHLRHENVHRQSKYPEYSTCHVANVCSETGRVLQRLTAQGYSDTSTWARGQAWAILGYAQTHAWTKEQVFLETACGLAEHLITRMETAPSSVEVQMKSGLKAGRYVPLWDFDAPIDESDPLRDSSAAMIAANGLLIISNSLMAKGETADAERYLKYAKAIVKDTIALCFAEDELQLVLDDTKERVTAQAAGNCTPFDAILRRATANFNSNWTDKYYNHGLVYADYYFLEFGNRLLQMGHV